MIKQITIAFMLVLVLAGGKCTKDDPPPGGVEIDPSLLVRCPDLPLIPQGEMEAGALFIKYSELQVQYIECAIRNDCLIEVASGHEKLTCPALGAKKASEAESPAN